jgi:hypothetical protein
MRSTRFAARAVGVTALLTTAFASIAALAPPVPAAVAHRHPAAAAPPVVRAARAMLASAGSAGRATAATPATSGFLFGVAATGARNAWAVGSGGRDPLDRHSKVLIMHWNGSTWKRAATPRFPDASALMGVAVLSARNAWAVGQDGADFGGDSNGKALILHWDGQAWKQVRSPIPGTRAALDSVAAVSARDIWAVGQTNSGRALIVHWNGTAWHQVRAPAAGGALFSLSTAHDNIWAVGMTRGGAPLVIQWNGTSWRKVVSPAHSDQLNGIAVMSSGSVWAVGTRVTAPADGTHPLIIHWNGARWSRVHSPLTGGLGFLGLARAPGRKAWAVGATRHKRRAIVHWNGATWTRASTPRPAGKSALFGAAATSARSAWAVGGAVAGGVVQTLVLHWNGEAWKVVPS